MVRLGNMLLLACLLLSTQLHAQPPQEAPSAVGPVMQLLKSGRVPEQRLGTVLELICQRGNSHDLAYVFEQVLQEQLSPELRRQSLACLATAARTRDVRPAGDLSQLKQLLQPAAQSDRDTLLSAIELAGLWQVEQVAPQLEELARSDASEAALRRAAIAALAEIGGERAQDTLQQLAGKQHPQPVRYQAVTALAQLDLPAAAKQAAQVLQDATAADKPDLMLGALLDRQGGSEQLASALATSQIPPDVAKLALRYMYSVGRNDAELSEVLTEAAGLSASQQTYTPEELQQLAAQVVRLGDAERGEEIFRREDLSCMKCHAIGKAGGDIGPDLSAVGSSSPVDYILRSILLPSEAIKEQYETSVVITTDGKFYTGIVADRSRENIVLKTADGQRITIPTSEIEEELPGKSLMPQGLVKFLTRQELLDLVRFLSELGKPGPYAITSTPALQRWRVWQQVPEELQVATPDEVLLEERLLSSDPEHWVAAYSKVSGHLPLGPLAALADSQVLYLYGEIEVTQPGPIGLQLNSAEGVDWWLDERPVQSAEVVSEALEKGRHRITLRVDTSQSAPELKLQMYQPENSSAGARFVTGP